MPRKIEISHRTIIFIALFGASLWLLFQIRQIILGFFICIILMSSLNPSIKRLESWKFPRWLAIALIYLIVLLFLGFSIGGLVPPLIDQTSTLINGIPEFFRQFSFLGIDQKVIASQLSSLTSVPANIFKFIVGIFSNIVEIMALAVITFYLLLERKSLDRYLTVLVGEDKEKGIEKIVDKVESRLGNWVRGQLFLMIIVGVLDYIGFRIIGISYALPLAILAFLFEIIPSVGPTLAAFPAILIGLTISPYHALAAAGWSFLVQQIENSILVPRIMKTVVGVNSLVSILMLSIGFKIAGIGGAILAIPTFITLEIIIKEVYSSRNKKSLRNGEA